MKRLPAMAAILVLGLCSSAAAAYGQNSSELRHDQIKNEQKAEQDMAHGNYHAAKKHQRRAQADDKVRQAQERRRLEREQHHKTREGL